MVLSILSFSFDRGFAFHSRQFSLSYVALVQNVLGSVLPDSLSPEYGIFNGFPFTRTPFYLTGFHVASVFPMIMRRRRG